MDHLVALLSNLIVPHFVGRDARNVVALTDDAYRKNSNYKLTGVALWNCIGTVELAVWDPARENRRPAGRPPPRESGSAGLSHRCFRL